MCRREKFVEQKSFHGNISGEVFSDWLKISRGNTKYDLIDAKC